MTTVITIDSKYHFLIPKIFREKLNIRAGQKWQVVQIDDRLELTPVINLQEMRGFLKGIDTNVEREEDRV